MSKFRSCIIGSARLLVLATPLLFISHQSFSQGFEPVNESATWKITPESVFDAEGNPANPYVTELFAKLLHVSENELRFSIEEFRQLLERPESQEVYAKQLIKYATPRSKTIQENEHNDYSNVLLKENKIQEGINFLRENKTTFEAVEQKYGVARKDIVAILMWESGLGKYSGNYRVFTIFMQQLLFLDDAQKFSVDEMITAGEISQAAADSMIEANWKRLDKLKKRAIKGLVALLKDCKEKGMDPLEQRGSWGGAIGYVQFMPFNLHLAVDGDEDGKIDLKTWPDAIFSVANYLKNYGNYGTSFRARRKGIFSYNPINTYVDGVIKYADAVWERYLRES
ncbi:MAG TPA: lytic murein transglycosylase [bacterium]